METVIDKYRQGEYYEKLENHLLFTYPKDVEQIKKLSLDKKLDWYAYQFQCRDPRLTALIFQSPEFTKFWKWRVLMPLKIKRFAFKVKNLELFKSYKPYKKQ